MNLFYRVALSMIFLLIGVIGLKLLFIHPDVGEDCRAEAANWSEFLLPMTLLRAFVKNNDRYVGAVESVGRIASTAIAIPLVLEFLLDQTIAWLNPRLRDPDTLEDPLGHGLLLCALLFSSHLPMFMLGESKGFAKDLFFPVSRMLTVVAVLGKLNTFAPDIWNDKTCLLVVFYYLFMQLFIIRTWEYDENRMTWIAPTFQRLNSAFGCLGLIFICYLASKLRHIYNSSHTEQGNNFFISKKYLCTVLIIGILSYEACFIGVTISFMIAPSSYDIYLGICMFSFIVSMIILTVLPARVIRRSITAMEHKRSIQKEIDLKNTFVRYVSHEIRSPLSTTSLGIDCLHSRLTTALEMKQTELPVEELLELTRDSRISCAAALHTLNDLLLFDKIENNMLQLEKKETKCEEFFEDCIRPFIRQLKVAGLQFVANLDPRLGECMMTCDVFKMAQVVRNLISNAVKFTPLEGSVVVNANLVAEAGIITKLLFEVTDTGPGISKENQGKLFQQYVQINAAALQGGKGSGLGLWICDAIIRQHDGKIGVSSRGEGYGSTFFFEIPVNYLQKEVEEESSPVEKAEEGKAVKNRNSPLSDSQVISGQEYYKRSSQTILLPSDAMFSQRTTQSMAQQKIPLRVIDLPQGLNPPFSLNDSETSRKIKVLICDDSLLTRKMVERLLRPFDMNIYHCNNGKAAVDKVFESLNAFVSPDTPLVGAVVASSPQITMIHQKLTIRYFPLVLPSIL